MGGGGGWRLAGIAGSNENKVTQPKVELEAWAELEIFEPSLVLCKLFTLVMHLKRIKNITE
jgi:hypothetical protein